MKILAITLACFLPLAASAQQAVPLQQAPSNVEIIDGKKFFSLRTARRMQGSTTTLSPGAQAVMNHPRADYRLPPSERLAMTPVQRAPKAGETAPQIMDQASDIAIPRLPPVKPAGAMAASKPEGLKQELLSIFAPDDRSATATK